MWKCLKHLTFQYFSAENLGENLKALRRHLQSQPAGTLTCSPDSFISDFPPCSGQTVTCDYTPALRSVQSRPAALILQPSTDDCTWLYRKKQSLFFRRCVL